MITIVCGTNRPKSNSERITQLYGQLLADRKVEHSIINLIDLPRDFVFGDMYGNRSDAMQRLIDDFIDPSDKFVFIVPEYNGGFPGILKAFVDAVPPQSFHGKKAGLIGLSSGQTGSLRGMDQFSNVLNYLRVNVLYAKPKLSQIESCFSEEGELQDQRSIDLIHEHVELMLKF